MSMPDIMLSKEGIEKLLTSVKKINPGKASGPNIYLRNKETQQRLKVVLSIEFDASFSANDIYS